MGLFLSNRDDGKTDELGHNLVLKHAFSGDIISGFIATQAGTPGLSIEVGEGYALVTDGEKKFEVWSDATETLAITTPNVSNPRIDLVVGYVDLDETVQSTDPNNEDIFKLAVVAGTPAGSPSVPSSGQIQSAIGASNPYIIIAQVAVGAGVTTITNGNITDSRTPAYVNLAIYANYVTTLAILDDAVTAPKVSGLDKSNLTTDSNPYKFSVYRNAAANSGNGAFAKVSFDTELFDTNSNFASGSYTAPVSGFYQFNWSIRFGAGDKDIASGIVVNGSSVRIPEARGNASTAVGVGSSSLIQLTAGDVVEVHAYASTTQALAPGLNNCWFDGFLVSRT